MDGASKFVKGDAMAGVVIVAINLLGGIGVGVLQQGMSFSEAIHTFSLLTIGDGLAAQIPALLISTATGIIVTRSASEADLGREIIGADPAPAARADDRRRRDRRDRRSCRACRSCRSSSSAACFFVLGRAIEGPHAGRGRRRSEEAQREQPRPRAGAPRDAAVGALAIDPLELAIGFGLVPLVDAADRRLAARARRRRPPPDRGRARAW